ncbi:citrate lyase holo-[acyl-carrier protein] synthase [Sedimentibacter sp. MB31-C6]|uniref:citrate lyase holo-[acyl-carrier protein] synthase n=1 Tax=Sedimentibacter sp. MB31-C6 TaxID=3109366 RepID=UPI002DDD6175|nr:citrate lyase holo-[acyl-carrier protein] synthase [Sedimentibacter sp. MB36-C1]WSI03401.1 citrate lyase holo-[acyl-carrier protein] synthase [Sedimentibacter sp. MB36-C1]
MEVSNNFVENFLRDRDKRVEYQKKLSNKYHKSIVCIRVNFPGINKDNVTSRKINEIIYNILTGMIKDKIIYENSFVTLEGPISILVVNEKSNQLKENCLQIEEYHPLGRIVDIDVYDENYKGLSRVSFGRMPRRCYLCDELAVVCSRTKRHPETEIVSFIERSLWEYEYNIENNDYNTV